MALYEENKYIKCSRCNNDTFKEVNVIRVIQKPVKNTLTESTKFEKMEIGRMLECTNCGTFEPNPLSE